MRTVLVYRSALLARSEVFIRDQAKTCTRWRTVLIGRTRLDDLSLDGLPVRILGRRPEDLPRRITSKLRNVLGWPDGVSLLRQGKPALLHAHFGPDAVEAWTLARALNIPLLATLHGFDIMTNRDWWESGRGGAGMRNYPTALARLAAQPNVRFIAVSDAVQRAAVAFGLPAAKIDVRYIGIDPEKFAPGPFPIAQRPRRVLFVGRLVEKKGASLLLEAMSKIKEKVPRSEVVVVGDGPLRGTVEALARQKNLLARFTGALSHEDVGRELANARVFCLPSIRAANGDAEGFGLVLLEAQAAGVPVVSSAIGGAEEGLLDGRTGFRVAEGDVDALSDRLARLLTDDNLAATMAAEGPLFVRSYFDIRQCTAALEDLYDAVVASPQTAAV